MGASILSPEGHLRPQNTALPKIHHTTTRICSRDTENKHDTYTELPNDGKHRRQSTSDYVVPHKKEKKLLSFCKKYYQIHPNMATDYIRLNIIIICTSYTGCIYKDILRIKNCDWVTNLLRAANMMNTVTHTN